VDRDEELRDRKLIDQALDAVAAVDAFAAQAGETDLRRRIGQLRQRWSEGTVRVAVAGMQKRGKSRLINALLNRPDLLPVDEDVATDSHIRIGHGRTTRAEVRRAGEPPTEIPVGEIREYASLLGDPAKRRNVVGVWVSFPHDLLDGLEIYDTPGVDSLTIGHRHATQMIVRHSDVLLFAVSGQDQPLLRHELEFLVEAAATVDRVAFVLTKVDNAPRWNDLLATNRERLRAHLEAPVNGSPAPPEVSRRLLDAPWFPVSSRRAEVAAARALSDGPGQAERAGRLLAGSGMPELTGYLRACAADRDAVRLGPLLTAVGAVAEAMTSLERDRLAAATDDDQVLRDRQAEAQAALETMTRRIERRKLQGTRLTFLAGTVERLVRARVEELRKEYADQIDTADLTSQAKLEAYAKALPEDLDRAFDALWQDLFTEVQDVVTASLNEFLEDMQADAVDLTIVASRPATGRPAGSGPSLRKTGFDAMEDGVRSLTLSWALAGIVGHLLMPGVGVIVGPAVAGLVGWRLHQRKVSTTGRSDLRNYVRSAAQQIAADMAAALSQHVQLKQVEVTGIVDAGIATQREDLRRRIADIKTLQNQDEEVRRKVAAEATTRLGQLAGINAGLARARAALTAPATLDER
jgi:hypothetical protein